MKNRYFEDDWIETYELQRGDFDILDVNSEFVSKIPTATQMGKVYQRLICDTSPMRIMWKVSSGFTIMKSAM